MRATIADFMPENVDSILRTSHWAILSAERPEPQYSGNLAARINAARTTNLRSHLDRDGFAHTPTLGRYEGVEEHGSLVFGISPERARAFGILFQQETVLVPAGLMTVETGFVQPALGVTRGLLAAARAGHTHLYATGATFAIDLAPMLLRSGMAA